MNYSIPIVLSLIVIIFCVCFLLFANGVIKMPETKTEILPKSNIDKILEELENLSSLDLQKLKLKIEKIFKNKGVILPTY